MKRRFGHGLGLILLFTGACAGCDSAKSKNPVADAPVATATPKTEATAPPTSTPAAAPAVSSKRVTERPANPNGEVFIVEYHHIRNGKGSMFRTTSEFKSDLERFYKDGFRPATVSEYLDDKMPLPPGASPMVFTFDDANPSQIKFREDGSVDPDCAIGIWMDFAKDHPDFPVRATFYVLPDVMWGQKKWVTQKIALLHSLGCELADHTMTHPILRHLSDDKVKWEIGEAAEKLKGFGETGPYSLAFPYGVSPKNKSLAQGFEYKGAPLHLKAALLVGANPAPSPTNPKLNRYRIPRVQACAGPSGLDDWMNRFEMGLVKVYVAP
jgi:hypothetical protein